MEKFFLSLNLTETTETLLNPLIKNIMVGYCLMKFVAFVETFSMLSSIGHTSVKMFRINLSYEIRRL